MFAQKFVLTKKGLEQRRIFSQFLKTARVFFTKHQRKHEPSPYPPSSTPPHEDGKTRKARVW
jgi:hypothetical protein